ncbi:hypothetical protein F783_012100 [Bordetella holmesii F627]|nr:hypothetical protein F783_012100 [Bordetella holmesii F627]
MIKCRIEEAPLRIVGGLAHAGIGVAVVQKSGHAPRHLVRIWLWRHA